MKKVYFNSLSECVRYCVRLTAKELAEASGLTLEEIARPKGARAKRCRKGIALVAHRQFLQQALPVTSQEIDEALNTITQTNLNRTAK